MMALTRSPNKAMLQLEALTICHANSLPGSTRWSFFDHNYWTENAPRGRVKLMDDYLASSKNTLRGYRRLPSATGIIADGSTLKRLLLDVRTALDKCGDGDHAVLYRQRDWAAICRSLTNVQQLAVAISYSGYRQSNGCL